MKAILNKKPILSRFLLAVLLPFALALVAITNYYYGALPDGSNEVTFTTESKSDMKVKLHRDKQGVVFVEGQSLEGIYAGLGFAHAQDRLWQMELLRRKSAGRMSEVFGEQYMQADKFARTLGLYQSAQADYQALSGQAKSVLAAYSEGVNRWIGRPKPLSVEFSVMGVEPEPWQAVDSLAILKLNAFASDDSFVNELFRMMMARQLGSEKMKQIFTNVDDVLVEQGGFNRSIDGALMQLFNISEQFLVGLNSATGHGIALSSERSQTGEALIAGDIHHINQIPSHYYAANLSMPDYQVSGMTMTGVPLIISGRNQAIAWHGTALKGDTQDIYFESLNMAKANSVRQGDGFVPLSLDKQYIEVKSNFPSSLREPLPKFPWSVRQSANGPLISDVLGGFAVPMSLRWTGFSANDSSFDALLNISMANSFSEFKLAAKDLVVPATAYVFADAKGNIAQLNAGKLPKRLAHSGGYPVPGWVADYQWQGMQGANFELFNPQSGVVVAANQGGDDAVGWHDAQPNFRYQRLMSLVNRERGNGEKLSVNALEQLSQDQYDGFAAKVTGQLSALKTDNPRQAQALKYLADWDFNTHEQSVAATIFFAWTQSVIDAWVFNDAIIAQLGINNAKALGLWLQRSPAQLIEHMLTHPNKGCEVNCNQLMLSALDSALDSLELSLGSDMDDWIWVDAHRIDFRHSVFADVNVLNSVFNRQVNQGGSIYTIKSGGAYQSDSGGYSQYAVSAFRQAFAVGNQVEGGKVSFATGQSGHWLSDFYDDGMDEHHQSVSQLKQ